MIKERDRDINIPSGQSVQKRSYDAQDQNPSQSPSSCSFISFSMLSWKSGIHFYTPDLFLRYGKKSPIFLLDAQRVEVSLSLQLYFPHVCTEPRYLVILLFFQFRSRVSRSSALNAPVIHATFCQRDKSTTVRNDKVPSLVYIKARGLFQCCLVLLSACHDGEESSTLLVLV